jgi:DNA-directed RNA polymerase specialized sigma24 family protein
MPSAMRTTQMKEKFQHAYDEYAQAIFRHCHYRVFDRERGKDLMQEVFLRAWEYMARGEEVHNMRAFLYRIANNLIVDESRKKREASLDYLQSAASIRVASDPLPSTRASIAIVCFRPSDVSMRTIVTH